MWGGGGDGGTEEIVSCGHFALISPGPRIWTHWKREIAEAMNSHFIHAVPVPHSSSQQSVPNTTITSFPFCDVGSHRKRDLTPKNHLLTTKDSMESLFFLDKRLLRCFHNSVGCMFEEHIRWKEDVFAFLSSLVMFLDFLYMSQVLCASSGSSSHHQSKVET